MDFIQYTNNWAKSEVYQGRVMILLGLILLIVFYSIFRSQNEFFRGALIPLGLLLIILLGYGSYILYSRPTHARQSIALYQKSKAEAIEIEKVKHINDNKAGKTLLKYAYPILMIISAVTLFLVVSQYYKGLALGFLLLFVSTYIIDNGFVTRSDDFLNFLNNL